MKKSALFICVSIGGMALTGCAQKQFVKGHFGKPSETVYVETLPSGALVESNYGQSCTTPCYIPVLRSKGGELVVSKEGYHSELLQITSSVSNRRIAQRSLDNAVEAIDPDPVSIALTSAAQILDGKGGVMSLDKRDFALTLEPIADGQTDRGAVPTAVTGERLTLDEWESEVATPTS